VAALTHLDTHVLVWLYVPELDRLSDRARTAITAGDLAASPITQLELTYLTEVGRLRVGADDVITSLRDQLGLRVDEAGFEDVVATAQQQSWTRDPFDRLIAAQSIFTGAALVTADESMRSNVPTVVW
jgi:PIN domain nuclease of toxin-antitoxin system